MPRDECQPLLDECRRNMEAFYAALHLAPPYHGMEQTLLRLSALFNTHPAEERKRLLNNEVSRCPLYLRAFTESGLHTRHRGIIARQARTDDLAAFPDTLRYLLEPFRQ